MMGVKYRPEIDGLRALAIIPVILFHAGLGSFSGGYVGVDIFFVISGFLITSIIFAERETGRFSFVKFYVRRARRILPALFLVLIATTVIAWFWMVPAQLREFGRTLSAVVLFASNIWLTRGAGYFDSNADANPLLHTWSLAAEEQYYFVFPLIVCGLWRFGRGRLCVVLAVLAISSLILAEIGWHTHPTLSFYLLPTRAWELLLGSLAACYMKNGSEVGKLSVRTREVLATIGLGMTLVPVFIFDRTTPFPSLYASIPTLGVVLLLVCATVETWVGRALALRGLVAIGLVSYSAYLWHQPLFAYARIGWGDAVPWQVYGGLIGVTAVLSYLSWRYVERPFRNPASIPRRVALLCIFSMGAGLLAAGLLMEFKAGFPSRLGDLNLDSNQYGGSAVSFKTWQQHGAPEKPQAFIVYGDSHALQYLPALSELGVREGFAFGSITHPACLALPGLGNLYKGKVEASCQAQLDELKRRLEGNSLPVVLIQRWKKQLAGADGTVIGQLGEEPKAEEALFEALDRLRQDIGPARHLILVGNVPTTNLIAQGGYIACRFRGLSACPETFPEQSGELAMLREKMKGYAETHENVEFFDPYDTLCKNGRCKVADGAQSLYSDHAHLSRRGATLVVTALGAQGLFDRRN